MVGKIQFITYSRFCTTGTFLCQSSCAELAGRIHRAEDISFLDR